MGLSPRSGKTSRCSLDQTRSACAGSSADLRFACQRSATFSNVAAASALSADPSGATLTISHPGFIRAFRTVKIVPREAKSLAIPIHALSYGHRAGELWDRMHLFIPKGKNIIAATIGGTLTPLYALCKSVTQKQDRSLLPSDAEFQKAAVDGAKGWLGMARAKGGRLS